MRMVDVIQAKRDGRPLSAEHIAFLVRGYTAGDIPDYQMSAFLMAVFFKGMAVGETVQLTQCMIESGDTVSFPQISGFTVDKHSTGGVGDKTTLVLAPLLASLGLIVAKLSGRGLGHTGGTIDKLEAIPGFRTDLSVAELQEVANDVGVAVAGATQNLVPADHKLYALRDVTATVDSIPLIASSIMSKKLAVQNDALVLDVKVGDGAFFRTLDEAKAFAELARDIGAASGRAVATVLTGMEQPLGLMVGNALEVKEAIDTLHGQGPEDLVEVCVALTTELMLAREPEGRRDDLERTARDQLRSGRAWPTFERWIERQGGDVRVVDDPDRLPVAKRRIPVRANQSGYVAGVRARAVGELAQALGAGRARKEDAVDPAAGVELRVKAGARVEHDDVLAVLHTNQDGESAGWEDVIRDAVRISGQPPEPLPVILGSVSAQVS